MASSLMENLTSADPSTWGPTNLPEKFKDMPYQPFSKSDRIGRIADWTGQTYSDVRLAKKYTTHFGSVQPYTYFVDDDDGTYQLVDAGKGPNSKNKTRLGRMGGTRGNWRGRGGSRGGHQTHHQQLILTKGAKLTRQQANQSRTKYPRQDTRRRYDNKNSNMKKRDASVYVQPSWNILEEMDFPRLSKLSLPGVSEAQDVYVCGAVEYYDKSFDRVNCKQGRLLQRVNRVFHKVTTTDDPIIRKLSKTEGNVFATDAIIATLMCAPRSVFSWDIVVQRVGDKLFFDKRDESDFDLLTVHETAIEMPFSDDPASSVNSPRHLALEATYINHNFSQQVLKMGEEKFEFENPNPFLETSEDKTEVSSVAYRYRKWKLGDDVTLVVRCEHDAAIIGPDNKPQFMNIKAFNEWDSRTTSNIDWRQKLDVQRGAVLASELKNNSNKLGKWTIQALLSGSDYLKFGYVSRVHAKDSSKHIILGTQTFKPKEFADQINLNMDNAWGILRCIIDTCMKLPEGRYLILKDPNKPLLVLYDVPNNAFSSDDEDDDDDDDAHDDDGHQGSS
ncbi:Eukaryotic translation initiation factor 3 subunit D, partial [Fragariocoptes setiger]